MDLKKDCFFIINKYLGGNLSFNRFQNSYTDLGKDKNLNACCPKVVDILFTGKSTAMIYLLFLCQRHSQLYQI